ncbi:SDR family oxidoreductase [Streptomyces sp. NBC_01525]|uniref:SDR family oxidoreductase n=1 Tax=Streptomyces sp. NBC_01525 TaxID=2903893 RepID=UPI00386565AB
MGGDPRDFTGRAVAVTGGTKGIGRALAEAFLTAGAEVTVCGRTAPSAPPRAGGRTAHVMCADVRDPAAAREFVDAAARRSGRLDVLVNNAGGSPDADAATVSPRFVEKVVALNLLAPFYASQAAHRHMHGQDGGGCILNIGSVSAHHPQPGTAAYSAAKAGLLMLTRALALEWGPAVRVNHLSAGPVRTAPPGTEREAALAGIVPLGRLALPSDLADACLYLAGAAAGYINGADLAVHGGGEPPARHLTGRPGPAS